MKLTSVHLMIDYTPIFLSPERAPSSFKRSPSDRWEFLERETHVILHLNPQSLVDCPVHSSAGSVFVEWLYKRVSFQGAGRMPLVSSHLSFLGTLCLSSPTLDQTDLLRGPSPETSRHFAVGCLRGSELCFSCFGLSPFEGFHSREG